MATGEVRATGKLGVATPGQAVVRALALRPDGGLAALVGIDRDAEGTVAGVVLAQHDDALRPLGDPVELVEAEESRGYALEVLPDGAVLASVLDGDLDTGQARLVTVRDGAVAVTVTATLPGPGIGLAVALGGEHVYVAHGHPDRGSAVATVDAATGDTVAEVPLCADGYTVGLAPAADRRTVLAGALSTDERTARDLAVLVG